MKLHALILVLSCLGLKADPLVWRFDGTTDANASYKGSAIAGHPFELRIFLDTSEAAVTQMNLADVFYPGPHQGEVEIESLGILPVNAFLNVQYFAPGGNVTGVQLTQPAFSDISFPSIISTDPLHLTPIPATAPKLTDNTLESGIFGPNGLELFGPIATFSATLESTVPDPVPEGGATGALLAVGILALGRAKVAAVDSAARQMR